MHIIYTKFKEFIELISINEKYIYSHFPQNSFWHTWNHQRRGSYSFPLLPSFRQVIVQVVIRCTVCDAVLIHIKYKNIESNITLK